MVWEEFHENKNDNENKNKQPLRPSPLSEHTEQPRWDILFQRTREMKNEPL